MCRHVEFPLLTRLEQLLILVYKIPEMAVFKTEVISACKRSSHSSSNVNTEVTASKLSEAELTLDVNFSCAEAR